MDWVLNFAEGLILFVTGLIALAFVALLAIVVWQTYCGILLKVLDLFRDWRDTGSLYPSRHKAARDRKALGYDK